MKIFKNLCYVLLIISFLFVCGCESYQDEVVDTIEGYIGTLETHNIKEINKYLSDDIKFEDDGVIETCVNTILYSEVISIESDSIEINDEGMVEVNVCYKLTYNDEYIPIGNRTNGENIINEIFTLQKTNEEYVITGMISK